MENSYTDSKKAVLAVYEVLKNHTSYDSPLSKEKIRELVLSEYNLKVSRNTIKDTVDRIQEFLHDITQEDVICSNEADRAGAGGEKVAYKYDYFFDRDATEDVLSDEEISKLVNVCLYARSLNAREARELIGKLKKMATSKFRKELDYTDEIPEKQFNVNAQTSYNLQLLRKVISKNHGRKQQWVMLHFNYFNANNGHQLNPDKEYKVLPWRICEANHKYYLLCAMERSHENKKIYHLRIDLMTKIKSIEHEIIPELEKLKRELAAKDISDYMSSHLYMFYGEPRQIDLEIPKEDGDANLTFLVDAFGAGADWRVKSETEDAVIISIRCVPAAMKIFIMQYAGKGIRVAGPTEVKNEIDQMIKDDCNKLLKAI